MVLAEGALATRRRTYKYESRTSRLWQVIQGCSARATPKLDPLG